MKVLFLTIFFSIFLFYLVMNNKDKRAVLIMLFMIPFTYSPISIISPNSQIHTQLCGFLVFSVWLAMELKSKIHSKHIISWKELSPKLIYLYYFLFMGIILGIIYSKDVIDYTNNISLIPPLTIINNSINVMLVIMLLKILVNFQYDDLFRAKMAKVFCFTIFINVFSQILKILNMENIFWNLFRARGLFDVEDVRNVGLFYGFGKGTYLVLLISFSFLYYKTHKLLSVAVISATLVYAFFSGSRQYFVVMAFLLISIIFFFTLKRKLSLKYIPFLIAFVIIFFSIWNNALSNSVIVRRFTKSSSAIQEGDIYKVINRSSAIEVKFILETLKNTPVLGKGLLNLGITADCPFYMVDHVVWFNIYRKFGIIGVIFLLAIMIFPAIKLFIIIRNTKDKYVLIEGVCLFSLMASIFGEQFLANFFWFTNTMLLYAFVYFWVFSFINRQKHMNLKPKAILNTHAPTKD